MLSTAQNILATLFSPTIAARDRDAARHATRRDEALVLHLCAAIRLSPTAIVNAERHLGVAHANARQAGWNDRETLIGEDAHGNRYYVKKPTSGMVAESSHVKEIRSVKYAGGGALSDYDPDSVPVEWRLWLSGQQNRPPNIAPTSGANSTLDRLATPTDDAALPIQAPAELDETIMQNLKTSSSSGTVQPREYNPAPKKFQPQSWQPGGAKKE